MKNIIISIVILLVAVGFLVENRYTIIVDSPVVAKIDSWTGDVWIVNSGVWVKVEQQMQGYVAKEEKESPATTGAK